jgi:hypothetical protein
MASSFPKAQTCRLACSLGHVRHCTWLGSTCSRSSCHLHLLLPPPYLCFFVASRVHDGHACASPSVCVWHRWWYVDTHVQPHAVCMRSATARVLEHSCRALLRSACVKVVASDLRRSHSSSLSHKQQTQTCVRSLAAMHVSRVIGSSSACQISYVTESHKGAASKQAERPLAQGRPGGRVAAPRGRGVSAGPLAAATAATIHTHHTTNSTTVCHHRRTSSNRAMPTWQAPEQAVQLPSFLPSSLPTPPCACADT